MMRDKALVVVHQRHSYPGRLGRLLMERGWCLDVRCPNMGHRLPATLDGYGMSLMFGGPMSANDCHMPGIRAELDWLPAAVESGKPFVGVCLGAQMLARLLGARVARHPEGLVEIGYSEIRPTEAGSDFLGGPMQVYQWHREGFEVPAGAVLLAEGDRFPNQAFRWGEAAYGLQFHPEVTREMMERWTLHAAHRLTEPGAMPREAQLARHADYDPALDAWTRRFVDRLIEQAATARHPRAAA